MKEVLMMQGAMKLVEMCGEVKKGENVSIITDMITLKIAKVLAKAASEKEANEVTIFIMEPRKAHGAEPPKPIAAAMKNSDIIFIPTSKSIAHTAATQDAKERGVRVITMAEFTEDMLISGGIEANFKEQAAVTEKIGNMLTQAKKAEISTKKGTRLFLNLEGRKGRALTGLATQPGGYATPPNIEASIAPIEQDTNGVIVVDGSISGIGLLTSPVKIVFEKGRATSIEGGREADKLKSILASANDPNVYFAAEFGLGLNPKAELKGLLLEDEGAFGSAHIALGSNADFGGKLRTPLHIDNIIPKVTVKLDETLVFEDGELNRNVFK
jgi:2,5-dihydroxypyridine 5,6-dioxygenase